MALRGGDRMEEIGLEPRGLELARARRPWALIIASLLLVVLAAVLWAKWGETRSENERLRAELKAVYMEAEAIRTQAAMAQQRVAALEKQLGVMRGERAPTVLDDNAKLEKPKAKPSARPARPKPIAR